MRRTPSTIFTNISTSISRIILGGLRSAAILSPKLPVEFLRARTATQQTADVELHGRTKRAKPRVPAAPLQTRQTSNAPRRAGTDPQSRNWSGPAVMMTTPERKRIRCP
ncbi:conserved hypothetical protein [Coccidioides posadasii str. Silveira]|uniref:Uncharacterized protein n=1 Tax=Coccidioides posadasii (strain RMSCC 757 / Silveira) TaxID=443226 RepID=E9D1G4_COCPS|nr:conserved hypothetical protein [Coccidioides posadasii str. Silveira]